MSHELSAAAVAAFHHERRSQRRQILTVLFLGGLLCLLILQVHHPADPALVAKFGDISFLWQRFSDRVLAPFSSPQAFTFTVDALGWILGATATTLIALVFSGRNPLGMADPARVMALDELLELLTLLVGVCAAATMWMALHNVFFLPADPDSGPKFFVGLIALILVIFSVVRQRDRAAQREIDEFHLTTSLRFHVQRWERMWGFAFSEELRVGWRKIARLALWWTFSGLVITAVSQFLYGGYAPLHMVFSVLSLTGLAVGTAALTAAAVSLYRSNPHPGVGSAYAGVLLVVVLLLVATPLLQASVQNQQFRASLLGYFLWLGPSLLLLFRKPRSRHMGPVQFRLTAPVRSAVLRGLLAMFDGARHAAFLVELNVEAHRRRRYNGHLAKLEAAEG